MSTNAFTALSTFEKLKLWWSMETFNFAWKTFSYCSLLLQWTETIRRISLQAFRHFSAGREMLVECYQSADNWFSEEKQIQLVGKNNLWLGFIIRLDMFSWLIARETSLTRKASCSSSGATNTIWPPGCLSSAVSESFDKLAFSATL